MTTPNIKSIAASREPEGDVRVANQQPDLVRATRVAFEEQLHFFEFSFFGADVAAQRDGDVDIGIRFGQESVHGKKVCFLKKYIYLTYLTA